METVMTQASSEMAAQDIFTDLIAERDLAKGLNIALRTLRRYDALRVGPAKTIIGRRIYYRRSTVQAWLASREQRIPAREYGGRNGRRVTRRGSR